MQPTARYTHLLIFRLTLILEVRITRQENGLQKQTVLKLTTLPKLLWRHFPLPLGVRGVKSVTDGHSKK